MERMKRQEQKRQEEGKKKAGIGTAIASCPQILGVLIAYLFYMMYSFCYSAFAVYYGKYIALDGGFMTKFLLISNVTGVIGSIVSRRVAKRLSAKGTYQVATIGIAALYMIAYLFRNTPTLVIIFMSIGGFFAAFTTAMTIPMLANCAIFCEYKTGVNVTGAVMGFLNVPIKVAVITRGVFISAIFAITGFSASIAVEEASAAVKNGIVMGFIVIPAILLVISFLVITIGYRLKDSEIEKYSAEIAKRNA